jgi:hypothetical protein
MELRRRQPAGAGAGLGATHQTGWTALVADLICAPLGTRD